MSVPVDRHGNWRAGKREQRGLRNFGLSILAIAALPFALGAYGSDRGWGTTSWPRVQATVLGSDLRNVGSDTTRGGRSVTDTRGACKGIGRMQS